MEEKDLNNFTDEAALEFNEKPYGLYLVATPIGNLTEITLRALTVLKRSGVIACEDTRRSKTLLTRYGIKPRRIVSLRRENAAATSAELISDIQKGETVSYISDAGMPGIYDPGRELILAATEGGVSYTVVSGACALINAAILSGMVDGPFTMLGFLPEKAKDRNALLAAYKNVPAPLIFYVPPHDLNKTIALLAAALGDRKAAVIREISKLYEEVTHITLSAGYSGEVRGEFALVVEGAPEAVSPLLALSERGHIQYYVNTGMSKNEAIKAAAKDRGVAKSEMYRFSFENEE